MRYVKWTLLALIILFVGSFVHYTLPQRDIVRVVDTYEERQSLSGWTTMFWSGQDSPPVNGVETRDVQFIQTVTVKGKPMVYRNEDTGWGWPPYFKFDTASLYTEAADATSNKDDPQWVLVTHYGWRSELLSTFPNAIGIKLLDDPDSKGFPWLNVVILVIMAIIVALFRLMWLQFRQRTIDPLVNNVDEAWDDATHAAGEKARGIKRWFGRGK